MLDVAIRRADGETVVDLGRRGAPPLPVLPALHEVMPHGLRRGSTVSVSGSVSLLLALLGAASADGAWCALVGMPHISAEAAQEYGIELSRLAVIPAPGAGWATAVGALIDAVDVVATRVPNRVSNGDIRRIAARVRTRDAVLVPFSSAAPQPGAQWPGAETRLHAHGGQWLGIGPGQGRLRQRRVEVSAEGRGQAARPRRTTLWLPAAGGGAVVGTGTTVRPVTSVRPAPGPAIRPVPDVRAS